MEEKDLQSIKAEIEQRRLAIEREIEEKKKKVEAEIAARRAEMEQKFAAQRLEMEKRHREQMQVMNREVRARDLAVKIETESLAPRTLPKQEKSEDPVERGIRQARENHPGFMADVPEVAQQLAREISQPVEESSSQEPEEERPVEQQVEIDVSGLTDKVVRFVKKVLGRETPEEIAQDIAEQDAARSAAEDEEQSEEPKEESVGTEEKIEAEIGEEEESVEVARKEKKTWWLRIGAFVIAAILLALTCFYGTVFLVKYIFGAKEVGVVYPRTDVESGAMIEGVVSERFNILVLGTDYGDSEADKNEPKRTDAMLLVSVDPQLNRVSVLSIPRDTKVILSGHVDPQKINAAYAFGGVMLAKQTVANLLGVPVTHYALADWQAFSKVVDLLGGVDLTVEHDMKYDDPYADLHIDIKAGFQHLDGKLAGQYVRYRSDEMGDIGRAQRQQAFIRAALQQMCKVSNLVKIPSIVRTVSDYVETDLSFMNMVKLFNSVKIFGEKNVRTGTLAGQFQDEDGISYWLTDEAAVKNVLKELEIPSSKVK